MSSCTLLLQKCDVSYLPLCNKIITSASKKLRKKKHHSHLKNNAPVSTSLKVFFVNSTFYGAVGSHFGYLFRWLVKIIIVVNVLFAGIYL